MRLLRAGATATLVEVDDLTAMRRLYLAVERARSDGSLPGVVDVTPAARTLLVEFDELLTTRVAVEQRVADLRPDAVAPERSVAVTIDVDYDGDDLDAVCAHLGLTRDAFIDWHTGLEWDVAFTGFAPGFGYLTAAGHDRPVPRLESPRPRVPAGSVAMAGEYTGVYPRESPGGWRIVGRTSRVLFDLEQQPPALLAPGRSVRFRSAS